MRPGVRVGWLALALVFTVLWMARSMAPALDPSVVQDDARQHVFWMQRLVDPTLLPDDLFADYFQSQSPPGYSLLFRLLLLAVDPLLASKLVPLALGILATVFTFLLVQRVYPSPAAPFLVTAINGWYVWQYDDLATGTPRAFLLLLTALLLYALVAGWRWWVVALIVAAEAATYPSAAALGVVLVGLRLVSVDRWRPSWRRDRGTWLAAIVSGMAALVLLLPQVLGTSSYGPTVDAATARQMPEFGPRGRNAFFLDSPYETFVVSYRGGFDFRVSDTLFPGVPIFYELAGLALVLLAAALALGRRGDDPPLGPAFALAAQVVGASLLLFLAAHLLLFKLYLPARFVAWTVPLALSLLAGVGVSALLARLPSRVATVATALLAVGLALYPARFDGNFVRDQTPEVSAYLREQPADTLILAVPVEADSIPAFTGRRVLTNREYALAYQLGFYGQVQQRTRDAIDAYYADTPAAIVEIARRYGVSIILVNRAAFDPATAVDAWAGNFEPYTGLVQERLAGGRGFALLDATRRCGVLTERAVTVITVGCLATLR